MPLPSITVANTAALTPRKDHVITLDDSDNDSKNAGNVALVSRACKSPDPPVLGLGSLTADQPEVKPNIETNEHGEIPIDDQGDLRLKVTAGPRLCHVYKVDSRALARASDFWNKLIARKEEDERKGQNEQKERNGSSTSVLLPASPSANASEEVGTGTTKQLAAGKVGKDEKTRQEGNFKNVAFAGAPTAQMESAVSPKPPMPSVRTIHLDLVEHKAHMDSLGTLLYAVHGRLDRVPTQPEMREFCSLVVLANWCDMVPIMRGHIHTWLNTAMTDMTGDKEGSLLQRRQTFPVQSTLSLSPGIPPGLFLRLRIFWEVGNQAEFQKTLAMLAWHTQKDGHGELLGHEQNAQVPRTLAREEVVSVTGVLENVEEHRLRIVTLALELLQRRIRQLQGPMTGMKRTWGQSEASLGNAQASTPSCCSCAVDQSEGPDCDAYYYGLLVQEFRVLRVDPYGLPAAKDVKKSPHGLCMIFEAVHDAIDQRVQAMHRDFLASHEHCNPLSPMIVQLKSLRDVDSAELTMSQRKHFQEQSQKMGKNYGG